jgi:peptide/nickel transport system substrate-binding protein
VPAALGFNLEREPLDDLAFRQAVTCAINYLQISELVFGGYGMTPTGGFSPPTHPNHNNDIPQLEYNSGEAEGLLDSIGIVDTTMDGWRDKDGEKITLTLLTRSDMVSMLRTAEMVEANLNAIGLDTTIRAVDSATWIATKNAKNYDLVFFRGTPWGMLMHAGHGSGYFDSRRTGAGVLFNLDDPEYLAKCDARLATALPHEQAVLDKQIQQLHADLLPGIALVWIESVYPYRKGWENWVVDHIFGGVVNSFSWFTVTKAR